ncbi:MAG: CCA tRNA nucleotidyltransferase [Pseudooceanicola sp.]
MTRVAGDWLTRPATQFVCAMLENAGHQALFVGGCVRDALVGRAVNDIDLATDAHPDKVMTLAKAAGLKAIPTGIEHGTVTVISETIPHEITTFRRDIETDGRRAIVAFSDRIEDDARRRDFTMNALYADARGLVIDPLSGLADLKSRRVRFIEDPNARITEDYLRILRFFRFHAWYGDPAQGMNPEALAAIAANSDGLESLSKERVGHEILRLLSAPDPAPSVAAMRAAGVLSIVIPGADDRFLAPLVHLETRTQTAPDAIRRLAVLGGKDPAPCLRLSRAEGKKRAEILDAVADPLPALGRGYRYGLPTARDGYLINCAMAGHETSAAVMSEIERGSRQTFPVNAADVMPAYQGPAISARLKQLEIAWIESGFRLSKQELLGLPDAKG